MAFSTNNVIIVRTGGSDTNGGAFNPANVNFATDLAATNANTSAPVVSSASYTFVSDDIGARVFIKSGTNWIPGWYTIASVAGGAATLTASAGTATLYTANPHLGSLNTAVGCASVASPTGGTFGVDYSNQDAARIAFTDMVIDGTTNTIFSSAANPVGKNFVGNHIRVVSGTGFTVQTVEVVSTSGTNATCDKSLGTLSSTGGNGNLGGAVASPGMGGLLQISGTTRIFIRTGTYTLGSASSNVSTGRLDKLGGLVEGFATIPYDYGTAPVISSGAQSNTFIVGSGSNNTWIRNLEIDGNSGTTITGLSLTGVTDGQVRDVIVRNCTVRGLSANFRWKIHDVIITGCSGTAAFYIEGSGPAHLLSCEAYSNSCPGFRFLGPHTVEHCLSYANSGASTDGFLIEGIVYMDGCVAFNNGRHGFNLNVNEGVTIKNSIAEGHTATGAYGFRAASDGSSYHYLWHCAGYNNQAGNIDTVKLPGPLIVGFINNTTGSFFVDAGAADFALNATANQGALARATGFPGTLPRGLTSGYADIGAVQHQDAGGGAGVGRRVGFGGLVG